MLSVKALAQALQQQLLHHNRVYPWWNALCLLQTNVALSPRVSKLHPGISKQTVASGSFMLRGPLILAHHRVYLVL